MYQLLERTMSKQIVSGNEHPLAVAGRVANGYAAANVFEDFLSRKADKTIATYRRGLDVFGMYLADVGVTGVDGECLMSNPDCWQDVTWGIVEGFVRWMLDKGYAIATINHRLTAVKIFAKLASKAGALDKLEYLQIKDVTGYGRAEAKRIDARRDVTRVGRKKAHPVSLTPNQARQLRSQPLDTPQGRRDALLMCLLLEHGLRVGEAAGLTVDNFNLDAGELTFYRPKVDKWQTHKLTPATLAAARAYFQHDAPDSGRALLASRKGGSLINRPMSTRAMTKRVNWLGRRLGIDGLSAHDCRHYWATDAARNKTDLFSLQQAGGWASLNMPRRYVEEAKIANAGVKLSN